jgi:hypothetical protein
MSTAFKKRSVRASVDVVSGGSTVAIVPAQ